MSAHTPGPWRVAEREWGHVSPTREITFDVEHVPGVRPTTYNLAEVCYPTSGPNTVGAEERLANARLIATAPDLLAALKALVEGFNQFVPDITERVANAERAILKAEGKQS